MLKPVPTSGRHQLPTNGRPMIGPLTFADHWSANDADGRQFSQMTHSAPSFKYSILSKTLERGGCGGCGGGLWVVASVVMMVALVTA